MKAPHFCLCFLSLLSPALGSPLYSPDIPEGQTSKVTQYKRGEIPNDTYQRLVSNRCNQTQLLAERVAWAEAGIMANALNRWVPGSNFQNAINMYLGTQSTDTGGIFGTNYKERLQGKASTLALHYNIRREFKLHNGQAPGSTYTYVYCDEQETPFKNHPDCPGGICCTSETGAYTWDSLGWFWTNHMVVLCPIFFEQETMSHQLQAIKKNPGNAKTINSMYWNQGSIYFHETIHFEETVSNPHAIDVRGGYGPANVFDLAQNGNTPQSSINADSYTMASTALFLMQTFALNEPPTPEGRAGNTASISGLPTPGITRQFDLYSPIDFAASWTAVPQNPNDPNSKPDMTKWQWSQQATLNASDYTAWGNGGTVPTASANVQGYIYTGDCTKDFYIWRDVSNGCITYDTNGQAQKMYSVYVDNPDGNHCSIFFYSDTQCSESAQLGQFTNVNVDGSGCQTQASSGFMSFSFGCSLPPGTK